MTVRRRTVGLILAATSLAIMAASCSSEKPSTQASKSASPSPSSVAYTGPRVPGLAATPLWGAVNNRIARSETVPFGDVIAVPSDKSDSEKLVLDLRGLADGKVRATIDLKRYGPRNNQPQSELYAGTWQGKPALYYRYTEVTGSDGLSSEKQTGVVEAYDSNGTPLGSAKLPGGTKNKISIVDGWVLTATEDGDASVSSPDGAVVIDSLCGDLSKLACRVEVADNRVTYDSQAHAAIAGNLAFTSQTRTGTTGRSLVAIDLTTGKPAWNSGDLAAPQGVPSTLDGLNALPIIIIGKHLVMHWRHSTKGSSTTALETTVALHDPATGAVAVTGPKIPVVTGLQIAPSPTYLVNADATVGIISSGKSTPRTAAFDLTTGKLLWIQNTDEKNLWPFSIVGDVLYGHRSGPDDPSDPIAVELTTKKVIADLADGDVPIPVALPNGYGLIVDDGVFVFAPE